MDAAARQTLNALMVRLADGDRAAFDGVYSALLPAVTTFCLRMLPRADADDAAQEALLKVFGRASTFDRDRDALTWAITIAAWEVRTIQKRRVRSRVDALDEHECQPSTETPEALFSERQLMESARLAVGALSEADQQTLMATFDEEKLLGVTNATFRKRRERALARLKDAWRRIYGT